MVAKPAVQTAGGFVLPDFFQTLAPNLTCTVPTPGLEEDETFLAEHQNWRFFHLIYRDLSGQLRAGHELEQIITDLTKFGADRDGHVLRTVSSHDGGEFYRFAAALAGMPWMKYDWFRTNWRRWVEEMPMPSEKFPGQIAFYTSPAKRAHNRQTAGKPGRWLNRVFGDILTQPEIQQYGLEWEVQYTEREVTVTQDPDEIEDVYKSRHLDSCMWFPANDHDSPVHPARVYSVDLGIAYLGTRDNCLGRCLVWPQKKIYLQKSYGDGDRLHEALKLIGYREARGDYEFTGARLLRISAGKGRFVMPYSDTHEAVYDNGTYLILDDDGDIGCQNSEYTDGLSYDRHNPDADDEPEPETTCDDCGTSIWDRDDSTYVPNHGDICERCYNRNYFYCEIVHENFHDDDRADAPSAWMVSTRGVKGNPNWFYCEYSEGYFPKDSYTAVELVEGGYAVDDEAESNGFQCAYSGQWSFDELKRVELDDDTSVHLDSFDGPAAFEAFVMDRMSDTIQIKEAA